MNEPINGIITAWMPEQDQHRLAVLGKLIEECNELAGRAARCIIQGLDGIDPATGRSNIEELDREGADVIACLQQCEDRLGLVISDKRIADKFDGFNRWHDLIGASEKSDAA